MVTLRGFFTSLLPLYAQGDKLTVVMDPKMHSTKKENTRDKMSIAVARPRVRR